MNASPSTKLKVFVIAGEDSGDNLGGALLKAMHKQSDQIIEIYGIGGAEILNAGLKQSLFPMKELSIMGLAEILPKVPHMLRRIKQAVLEIERLQPDIILSIDAPDFCFRVQKAVKKRGKCPNSKQIHYGAPTVWAWRAGRAKKIAKFLDGLICLFPFEPKYFEAHGIRAIAAGHPVVGSGALQADGSKGRPDIPLKHKHIIGLLLGSRSGELKYTAPALCETVRLLQNKYPDMQVQIPTLPRLETRVNGLISEYGLKNTYIRTDKDQKWNVFASCSAALAVSGTVGLELCMTKTPHITAYKMAPLTFEIMRRVVKTPFIHLGNIILNKPVIPEFIQHQCKPVEMALTIEALLFEKEQVEELHNDFIQIAKAVGAGQDPAQKAAVFTLNLLC